MSPSAIVLVDSEYPVKKAAFQNGEHGSKTTRFASHDAQRSNRVLRTFRCLVADLCEQFKGGHPGYVVSYNRLEMSRIL